MPQKITISVTMWAKTGKFGFVVLDDRELHISTAESEVNLTVLLGDAEWKQEV